VRDHFADSNEIVSEDIEEGAAAMEALAEPSGTPWEQVKAEHGLSLNPLREHMYENMGTEKALKKSREQEESVIAPEAAGLETECAQPVPARLPERTATPKSSDNNATDNGVSMGCEDGDGAVVRSSEIPVVSEKYAIVLLGPQRQKFDNSLGSMWTQSARRSGDRLIVDLVQEFHEGPGYERPKRYCFALSCIDTPIPEPVSIDVAVNAMLSLEDDATDEDRAKAILDAARVRYVED